MLNLSEMIGLVGSIGILAAVMFLLLSLALGYLLVGFEGGVKKNVMGLGAAQHNIAAALVVAGQNFGIDVITYLMVVAIIGLMVLMPLAGELGRRRNRISDLQLDRDTPAV